MTTRTAAPAASISETPETLLLAFQALSDANRLRIVDMLRGGERCVCQLVEALDMSQPLLSHHLKTLKEAGLVRDRREGRWAHYALVAGTLQSLEAFLRDVRSDAGTALPNLYRCS
jgi:ArsR family transcriptional regulator